MDLSVVNSDVRAAGIVGMGGLELLGYYLYGGPPSNEGRGDAAPVNWATYGFGTQAWRMFYFSRGDPWVADNLQTMSSKHLRKLIRMRD